VTDTEITRIKNKQYRDSHPKPLHPCKLCGVLNKGFFCNDEHRRVYQKEAKIKLNAMRYILWDLNTNGPDLKRAERIRNILKNMKRS
jgi:hypothetical protein